MSASIELEGFNDVLRMVERELPETFVRVQMRALRAGSAIIAQGIKNSVPAATTKGHDNKKLEDAVGFRVKKRRKTTLVGSKIGFAVGKKRGTFPPHGVFHFTGTKPRYQGLKRNRKTKRDEKTGKKIRFVGFVRPNLAVQAGFIKTKQSARTKMLVMISRSIRNFKKKQAASQQQVVNG